MIVSPIERILALGLYLYETVFETEKTEIMAVQMTSSFFFFFFFVYFKSDHEYLNFQKLILPSL